MATLSQRLRELDRKVLREDRFGSAEFCAKQAAKWWRIYLLAAVVFLVPVVAAVFGYPWFLGSAGASLGLALQAGMLRAEHLRIKNPDQFMGRPRPPGL